MPRDEAGIYTLPATNPVVSNTTITAVHENTTNDDMAEELTNSLDRRGRGGMTGPFSIADGVVSSPGLAFTNDSNCGLYRIGEDDWALAAGGGKIIGLSTASIHLPYGKLNTGEGANAMVLGTGGNVSIYLSHVPDAVNYLNVVPGIADQSVRLAATGASPNVDMTLVATGSSSNFNLFAGNTMAMQISAGAAGNLKVTGGNPVTLGVAAAASLALISPTFAYNDFGVRPQLPFFLDGGGDTYIKEAVANQVQFVVGGTVALTLNPSSGASAPLGFGVDPGTPLYLDGGGNTYIREVTPDVIQFVAGGAAQLEMSPAAGIKSFTSISVPSTNVLYLDGGSDTYLLEPSGTPNTIRLVTGGAVAVDFTGAGLNAFRKGISIPATEAFYLDGGSNTYIQESPANQMRFVCDGMELLRLINPTSLFSRSIAVASGWALFLDGGDNTSLYESAPDTMTFQTAGTERAHFNAAGYFKASNFGPTGFGSPNFHSFSTNNGASNIVAHFTHHGSNPAAQYGISITLAGDPNTGTNMFWFCEGGVNGVSRAFMRANGGLVHYPANDTALSARAVKNSIQPLREDPGLLANLWDAHKRIDWGRWKYNDQTHDDYNWGPTAEGVREAFADVAPELVEHVEQMGGLGIYTHDLQNITGSIVTELQNRIETLEAKLAELAK